MKTIIWMTFFILNAQATSTDIFSDSAMLCNKKLVAVEKILQTMKPAPSRADSMTLEIDNGKDENGKAKVPTFQDVQIFSWKWGRDPGYLAVFNGKVFFFYTSEENQKSNLTTLNLPLSVEMGKPSVTKVVTLSRVPETGEFPSGAVPSLDSSKDPGPIILGFEAKDSKEAGKMDELLNERFIAIRNKFLDNAGRAPARVGKELLDAYVAAVQKCSDSSIPGEYDFKTTAQATANTDAFKRLVYLQGHSQRMKEARNRENSKVQQAQ